MDANKIIDVIIPAYNEQDSVSKVIADIDKNLVREIVVIDNNSNDATAEVAITAGASVVKEARQGYGYACLKGIEYIKSKSSPPDIIVFADADYSDHLHEMQELVSPIINDNADLVIGSRTLGRCEKGAMTPQQLFGNWLATRMLGLLYKSSFSDLGPFRAIKWDRLLELNMQDETYGWTVEMQLKAVKFKYQCVEVPVSYRKRIGSSKISGTVKGTFMAGYKIITTILKYI